MAPRAYYLSDSPGCWAAAGTKDLPPINIGWQRVCPIKILPPACFPRAPVSPDRALLRAPRRSSLMDASASRARPCSSSGGSYNLYLPQFLADLRRVWTLW